MGISGFLRHLKMNKATTNSDGLPRTDRGGHSTTSAADTHHRRLHRHRREQRFPLIMGMAGLILLAVILTVISAIKISSLSDTNDHLKVRLQESEDSLVSTRKELNKTQRQLEVAVEGRFPQLRQLEFDKVLPIHNGGVKNIIFTLIKKSAENYYEYKIVMENDSDSMSAPEIKVLLFGQLGVQLGANDVPKQDPLLRGETRSYSSIVELSVPGEPYYFYIAIK